MNHRGSPSLNTGDVLIAVVGPTGVGKSSFINMASGSQLVVGSGLRSCTARIMTSRSFNIEGRSITLIDTPGFDDTTMSDTDVLKILATYFSALYENGLRLSGIIYLHRISDFRVGGGAKKNLDMFREMWGAEAHANVVIATTMWDAVDLERGESRERQLVSDAEFFQPMLRQGAHMHRYNNSHPSALAVLQILIDKFPIVLKIQRELVDENKDITQTGAGQVLRREHDKLVQKCTAELDDVRVSLSRALEAKDQQAAQELEDTRRTLLVDLQRVENDRSQLSADFAAQRTRAQEQLQQALQVAQTRSQEDRLYEQEIRQVRELLARDRHISAREVDRLKASLRDLQNRRDDQSGFPRMMMNVLEMVGQVVAGLKFVKDTRG